MSRRLRLLGLAAALLLVQWLWAGHGLAHIDDAGVPGDPACIQCLALANGTAAPPPAAMTAAAAPAAPLPVLEPPPARLAGPAPAYFRSRAPPLLLA